MVVRLFLLLFIICVGNSWSLEAATYYVSTTGNDAHACSTTDSAGTNKATPAGAMSCLSAGDTLRIHSGTYAGFTVNVSGSAGSVITIESYPGETATVS